MLSLFLFFVCQTNSCTSSCYSQSDEKIMVYKDSRKLRKLISLWNFSVSAFVNVCWEFNVQVKIGKIKLTPKGALESARLTSKALEDSYHNSDRVEFKIFAKGWKHGRFQGIGQLANLVRALIEGSMEKSRTVFLTVTHQDSKFTRSR